MSLPESQPDPVESVPASPPPEAMEITPPANAGAPEEFLAPAQPMVPVRKPFPAWSGWDVLAVAVFTGVCVLVFLVIALFASGAITGQANMSVSSIAANPRIIRAGLVAQAAAYLAVFGCIFLLVRSRAASRFGQAIQWNWPGRAAVVFFVGGTVLAVVVEGLSRYLPIPKSLPMDDLFTNQANAYFLVVFGITLAPLIEELFFRGLLYPVLRRGIGLIAAVLLTALAFSAIHGMQLGYAWAPLLSIFVVGVVFTVVRERRNSVAASLLMHCGYNFMLFSMLWFGTDHFRHLEKAAG